MPGMSFWGTFDTVASGLTAQRFRIDVIADNIANANTTRGPDGKPYRRKIPVFAARDMDSMGPFGRGFGRNRIMGEDAAGVRVVGVAEDSSPGRLVYDPSHPDADENGYVHYPNVNVLREMVDMIDASRAFEAGITVMNTIKSMYQQALRIGR